MVFSAWLQRRLGLDGIHIDRGSAWEVGSPGDSALFFRSLPTLFSAQAVLYLEGQPTEDVRSFLGQRPAQAVANVARGTIWPRPRVFHIPLTIDNMTGLAALAEQHSELEIADHVHVYEGERVLLEWHDALLDDPFLVSKSVPVERLEGFCKLLGVEYGEI